jgi:two-component system, cell cycle sensor histidine kinase PleC
LRPAQSPAHAPPDDAAAHALAEALDCLRVAVTLFDSQERLVHANQHFNYLFRSMPPRERLTGLTYADLIRLEMKGGEIAAIDAADPDAFIARRRAQLREGEYRPLDIALADGRIVEIKARRTRTGGWIALWSDVTEARHAQSRLEDALVLSADAFAFFDHNDVLAACNDAYASFYGFQQAGEVIGRGFASLMEGAKRSPRIAHRESPEEWLARRIAVHSDPAGAMTIELASGQAFLMRDRPTHEGGRAVVFTDVTDRRRVERAFEEQTKALAESRNKEKAQAGYLADLNRRFDKARADADTTKTTLMRTMSHELKTPLNAIIGFSDLMLTMGERFSPEQVKEYAGLIHDGGRNLLRLINQILDLTKLSAGRYELRPGPVDAGALLWTAHAGAEPRARAKSVAIETDVPPGLAVQADESAFGQMVVHLVDNAVAFTNEGGRIALTGARDGEMVRVRVADNGPGVPKEDIARILLPFEQGGRSAATHTAGAGLGLTLVKAFAEAQGGQLVVESDEGKGFAATIVLPAA